MKRSKDKLFNGRPLLSENLINFGNAFTMAAKMGLLSFENIKLKKKKNPLQKYVLGNANPDIQYIV